MANRVLEVYLVKPKAATNLITNPSFEVDTSGWTVVGTGASIARSTAFARRGLYGCEVTTAANVTCGAYFSIALASGTTYTFSVDVKDVAGQTFNIYFANTSGTVKGTARTWTGTGHWHRYSVTWTADASATFRLYVTRSSVNSTTKFSIDGAQLETGTESTYFDGSSRGYNPNRADYWWNGTPNASTSYRTGKTRTGGEIVRLRDFANILGFIGLGLYPVVNSALPSNGSGSFFQNSRAENREVTVALQFTGADYGEIMAKRAAVVEAVDPTTTPEAEPLRMRVVTTDAAGVWQSEMLDFPVHYAGGFEGEVSGDFGQTDDRALARFTLFLPFLTAETENAIVTSHGVALTNPYGVVFKDFDGAWKSDARIPLSTESVYAILPARDGSVYVGGSFLNAGGNANSDYISKWNGSSYGSLGAWALNGPVNVIVEGPDGALYIGGSFTNAGGQPNADNIFKWDGTNVIPLSTGVDGPVYALDFDQWGQLYVGGRFSSAGGVANTGNIARWSGTNWYPLGTGITGSATVFAIATQGAYVFVGGGFTNAGGVFGANNLAKWNAATSTWYQIGNTSHVGSETGTVFSMIETRSGQIYAGGSFSHISNRLCNGIARFNGNFWEAVPSPAGYGLGDGATVRVIREIGGALYIGGTGFSSTLSTGSVALLIGGTTWRPLDITLDGTVRAIAADARGKIYFGVETNTTATSGVVTVTNTAGARAYPRFGIYGPGTVWYIKNESSGKGIYFNDLTLQTGEVAYIALGENRVEMTSNWRGNLLPYAAPGSDFDLSLLAGDNNIAVFITGTGGSSATIMRWNPGYASIDKTER